MREQLIADLMALKTELTNSYQEVYEATLAVAEAKDNLQVQEDQLLITGAIDGKNAEARAAQMRKQTIMERQELADAENSLESAKSVLRSFQARLQIDLALVELVKGGGVVG